MLLLTPGPLTTDRRTREAMLTDWGSRDPAFVALVARVRRRLVGLLGPGDDWSAVPMQGSGTFAVEAMVGSLVPRDGHVLVGVNGAYGARMADLAERMGRQVTRVVRAEVEAVEPDALRAALDADPTVTHVGLVHSETTSGLLNPVEALAALAAERGKAVLVDAMSSFGVCPLPVAHLTAIAASANKCLEGIPGLAFVLARPGALAGAAGASSSLSLDLHDQWRRLEQDGQFRFTPPTHVLAALDRALDLLDAEGGPAARLARYGHNRDLLVEGMRRLGVEPLLPPSLQGPIIVTFREPPGLRFGVFYDALLAEGFAIYPGKLTAAPSFRIGCIGQVHPADMERFVAAAARALEVAC